MRPGWSVASVVQNSCVCLKGFLFRGIMQLCSWKQSGAPPTRPAHKQTGRPATGPTAHGLVQVLHILRCKAATPTPTPAKSRRGYSYEIIRAKTLYAKHARKVGSGVRLSKPSESQIPTKSTTETVEYGPHIPTLVVLAESGGLD